MFQTEGVVSASECWGAAMHAISQCFFIIFNKSGFGPPKSQCQLSNIITRSHTHRDTVKHTLTHQNKTKQKKTFVLLSKANDLSQLLIQPADAMCFFCYRDGPFSRDLHVLFQSKRDGMSNLVVSCYKIQITLRGKR